MTPGRRWYTPTNASTVMADHRPLSVMCSWDGSDWHVLSLMLSFHDVRDLRRLESTVPCLVFWQHIMMQTWPNIGGVNSSPNRLIVFLQPIVLQSSLPRLGIH